MPFSAFKLRDELLQAIGDQGYKQPSPIQTQAIPVILTGGDLIAVAQTGTGKTASFALPILQLLSDRPRLDKPCIRALVVVPTRELAAQVGQSIEHYSCHVDIASTVVYGGVRIEPQINELQGAIDVLVATPGRLIDLHNQHALSLDKLEILVLDEADRMLDLGFIDAIRTIQTMIPKKRQTLLFSATFSKEIKSLANGILFKPTLIELASTSVHIDQIKQTLHPVDKARKSELLIHLLANNDWQQVLVFIRTKREADVLRNLLESKNISAESIHANRTQQARTKALEGFKNRAIKVLVATDIASRGIDVNDLPCVINFDLPYVPEDYIHRIGRTGRASASGVAISFFSDDEEKQLKAVERIRKGQFKREIVPGFAPSPKAQKTPVEEDLYGNFEADTRSKRKLRSKSGGRKRRK